VTDHETDSPRARVLLRDVVRQDIPIFFEQQLDPAANYMAAFTCKDPTDRPAFMANWDRIFDDSNIIKKAILFENRVAGLISGFERSGKREVMYWLGRDFWGKGIATSALATFLREHTPRPLYARAARDNLASLRVLQKCGFAIIGYGQSFANARSQQVEEAILVLNA